MLKAFLALLKDHPPLDLRRGTSGPHAVHRWYTHIVWHDASVARKAALVVASLLWPFRSAFIARRMVRTYGRSVAAHAGPGIIRQFFAIWAHAVFEMIPPRSYYWYRLWDDSRRGRRHAYIHHHEIVRLLPALNVGCDNARLADKRFFARVCRERDLATIPVLAEFEGGAITAWRHSESTLPLMDLVVKIANLQSGRGLERWWFEPPSHFRDDTGRVLERSELLEHIVAASRDHPRLLQPRVPNHPALTALSTNGLCTVRVVTVCETAPQVLVAAFRMPVGRSATDNFHTGGLASPVDLATGRLGPAANYGSRCVDRHPDTGTRIDGIVLPSWSDVRDLCIRAHQAFTEFLFIGWDVAITATGPLLVEANSVWGTDVIQVAHDAPLGETAFVPHLLARLRQLRESAPTVTRGSLERLADDAR